MRVSVLMPVYNAADTLPAAWASIRDQTFRDWDLIVVDDGSTDGSSEVLAAMAAADARVRVVSRPHRGFPAALQAACRAAAGEYLARMDADDIALPERFARQAQALDAQPDIGLVACRTRFGGDARRQAGYAAHVDWLNGLLSPEAIAANRFVDSPVAHPTVMFRRAVMATYGGYRVGDFAEDYELWLRWLDRGVRFLKLPESLLVWQDRPDRLSRTHPRYGVENLYRLKLRYLARCLPADRPLWLWGAGRVTRQRFRPFETASRPFAGFIDIDPRKVGQLIGGRPVVAPEAIPPDAWIVVGVGSRGARELIARRLQAEGRRPVHDYLLCA